MYSGIDNSVNMSDEFPDIGVMQDIASHPAISMPSPGHSPAMKHSTQMAGDPLPLSPGYGGVAEQLRDAADVEKTGLNVGMRIGADEISGSRPTQNLHAANARARLRKK